MKGMDTYFKNQLKKMTKQEIGNLQVSNGLTYEQMMKSEVNRFWGIIENNFEIAYYSYYPKVYKRTGQILNSFLPREGFDIDISQGKIKMELLVTDNSWHKSMFDGWNGADIIFLYNYGYECSQGWHKGIKMFGYRPATHFIEKSIEEFESTSKYHVKVEYKPPQTIYS